MFPPLSRINKTVVFVAIFAVSLIARLIFVMQWDATPYGALPLLDAEVYDNWAKPIAHGQLMHGKAFYASPLYPYLLGLVYAFFGHDLLIAGFFNAVLGSLAAAVLAALTFELFGVEAGLATGFLAAFYRPLIFYTAPVMKESLGLLLFALFLVFALRALKQNRLRDFFGGGALLGLAALVRGNAILLAGAVLLLIFLRRKPGVIKNSAVFLGACVLFILPATIHNYIASHDFVPINYADGFNLYIGNSPTANGTNQYPPEISSDPTQEELTTAWVAQQYYKHPVRPSEVSKYWRDLAFDYMLHNPGREFVLAKNKVAAFWNNAEPFDSYDIGFIRKNFGTIIDAPLPEFWLITLLAAFGAVAAWREKREDVTTLGVLTFAYMASVILFYVTDRYRLSVVVFLLPLAGAAVPYGWKLLKSQDRPRLAAALAFGGLALFVSVRPLPDAADLTAFNWGTLATIYSDLKRDPEAIDALHKALALSPADPGAQSLERGSISEERLGDDAEAEHLLKTAIELYPKDGVVVYNYGRFKAARGDMQGALEEFQKAVKLSPVFVLNYFALARIYERLGDRVQAIEYVRQGISIDPSDPLLLDLLVKLELESTRQPE